MRISVVFINYRSISSFNPAHNMSVTVSSAVTIRQICVYQVLWRNTICQCSDCKRSICNISSALLCNIYKVHIKILSSEVKYCLRRKLLTKLCRNSISGLSKCFKNKHVISSPHIVIVFRPFFTFKLYRRVLIHASPMNMVTVKCQTISSYRLYT